MKTYLWKFFADYEKEEKWLNEMAAKGLALTDYSTLRYTFEECEPGEYIYRIEYLENRGRHPETIHYIRFMEDSGIEHIATFRNTWVYFRKKAADGAFEIYSDIESRIRHYQRISKIWLTVGIAELCLSFSQLPGIIDYFRGVNSYGLFSLVVGSSVILLSCVFFGNWRRYAKKIKWLKRERELHE